MGGRAGGAEQGGRLLGERDGGNGSAGRPPLGGRGGEGTTARRYFDYQGTFSYINQDSKGLCKKI